MVVVVRVGVGHAVHRVGRTSVAGATGVLPAVVVVGVARLAGTAAQARAVAVAARRGAARGSLLFLADRLFLLAFEAFLSSQVTAVLEHVAGIWVKGPETAFARLIRRARNLQKAVVETERMSNRVLPSLLVLPIVGKQVHDELIYLAKRQHFAGTILNGHCD